MQDSRLYLILDAQVCDHQRLWEVLKAGVNNGVDIVQLRDKLGTASKLVDFVKRAQAYLKGRVPFIVNDRADVALAAGASGVHVGQDDLAVSVVRKICGKGSFVGKSCQSIEHLLGAQTEGADYIGFGSVFKTKTKPGRRPMDIDLLYEVVKCSRVPVFAIGGITIKNIGAVRACGISRIAVCREILLSPDPGKSAASLKKTLIT
ncbi:MAG: thiamine phosphate synthase [Candidatus Omnitrophica bacterium]|nr:thiamine phosphate synthase [Candidatus Omnitrophota bacterium]